MKLKPSSQEARTNASDVSGKLFCRWVHRFLTPGVGSEFASDRVSSSSVFTSSHSYYMVLELAARFFPEFCPQNQRKGLTGVFNSCWGDVSSWAGGIPMHLKLFVLSASSVMLWLAPLAALDKTLEIHKALQGLSLTAAIACAVTAGNIAREQAEQNEIEEIKTRAITADVVDEIATSAYISQQQRQQEAEAILTSPVEDVEEARQALEAIYSNDSEETEVTTLATTSEPTALDKSLYAEICKSREVGKSSTWIIENILKMKGRKFAQGKEKLQTLLNKFDGEGKR